MCLQFFKNSFEEFFIIYQGVYCNIDQDCEQFEENPR